MEPFSDLVERPPTQPALMAQPFVRTPLTVLSHWWESR